MHNGTAATLTTPDFFSAPLRGAIGRPGSAAKRRPGSAQRRRRQVGGSFRTLSPGRDGSPGRRILQLGGSPERRATDGRFAAAPDDSRGVLRLESLRIEFWTRLRSRFAKPTLEQPRLASARRGDFPRSADPQNAFAISRIPRTLSPSRGSDRTLSPSRGSDRTLSPSRKYPWTVH